MVSLYAFDEQTSGERSRSAPLTFPNSTLSVRELIESRVEQEVNHRPSLIRPSDGLNFLPQLATPQTDETHPPINDSIETLKEIALKSFTTNGFFLLVDDVQLTELEQQVTLNDGSHIIFLKLVPLTGG